MCANIVDIEEYRRKQAINRLAEEAMMNGDQLGDTQLDVQIDLRIPFIERTPGERKLQQQVIEEAVDQYKAEVKREFSRLEKTILRYLHYMEFKLTLKLAGMCIVSIIVATAIISLLL